MKQTRRIPALLLAMVMLCSLALTGCKKEAPVAADKVPKDAAEFGNLISTTAMGG